jgi:3-methylcrotonyl-CoA carboxylase alpha subunit
MTHSRRHKRVLKISEINMFTKILIANRGEIACRVASTCAKLAIKTVAVYSDVDAHAKHVAMCDEAVHIGGNSPKESYLRWEKIIEVAKATGAQAIHPGYGFLSENDAFATACKAAGLTFIGPPASAIKAMGLKAESKRLMEKAGVPLVPGYHGSNQEPAFLQTESNRIGYPVLIKASAGGGGKGMRVVDKEIDFVAALSSCKREAMNSFGDDAVLIEKYVQRPRHIEIQVFGDAQGNYVYLFERDCSVQRRHQKVLEEAPAPGLSETMRAQMGTTAVAAARAVNYEGAGTVEFIVEQKPDGSMQFFFMEMNTRLQVEHPVTEAITGLDLVEWQLRVASGEALPLKQEQLKIKGHAIEARICAENPDNQFLPATGTLNVYALPASVSFERSENSTAAIRVDSGVRQGDAISPYYDSMIAKLIVYGDTREQALALMDSALAKTHVVGLNTNVQFLRSVVRSDSFSQANLDTGLIQREEKFLFNQESIGASYAVACAVAKVLNVEKTDLKPSNNVWNDPWAKCDGWQLFGVQARRFEFTFHSEKIIAQLKYLHNGKTHLTVGNASSELNFLKRDDDFDVEFLEQKYVNKIYKNIDTVHIFNAKGATQIVIHDVLQHANDVHEESGRLTAPMPGKIISFTVKVGEKVTKGQALAVMDAMKMEHTISSPTDGVVQELLYLPGDQVVEGVELLKLGVAV